MRAEQTMVSDGKKVTLWDPDLEQATIKKLDERLTQTPALLLSGDVSKISQSFDISARSRRRDRLHPQAENQGHPVRQPASVVPQRPGQ
jgi:outer membrane lipoprotein-sorting protein